MGRIYLPFEDVAMRPTFGPILPGTPHPTIVGNPHLRGGPFVGLPGYGMEAAELGTNLVVDPDFPDLANWTTHGTPTTAEVGAQFAMDQGEFLQGLHIITDADDEGKRQPITIIDATDYTFAAWAYVISGALRLQLFKGGSGYESQATSKVKEWERLTISFTSNGTGGIVFLTSSAGAAEGYFWMPQFETGTYAKPARVGAQPASVIYVPSPISETQTPWSVVCIVTPDWDYDTGMSNLHAWNLYEDSTNYAGVFYYPTSDLWVFRTIEAGVAANVEIASTHVRGDKFHLVATCDGYNQQFYVNGAAGTVIAAKSAQPTNLVVGARTTAANNPFNGVIDDFAFIEGTAIPEFRVAELYRASLRGVPLHGVLESLS